MCYTKGGRDPSGGAGASACSVYGNSSALSRNPRMDVPYAAIFGGLLLVYMAYSVWARLDGRYPIAAALVLLVVTAVVDALGNGGLADTLAEFVFFLLAAGVVLLLVEHLRDRPRTAAPAPTPVLPAQGVPPDPSEQREGPTEQPLEGLQQEAVPVVHGPGDDHRDDEQ